ncbi:MAG: hypothetical protein CFE43_09485 [Burkholderiales bacterium PBB3]|nr:MAG: hypothetical protein CFE43_09485 [Burkholderiales bacterium PBB3]
MEKITRVGVDLAKRVYQVHAVDNADLTVLARPMSPERFLSWALGLPAGAVVAMESCSGVHHLARRLRLMGLDESPLGDSISQPNMESTWYSLEPRSRLYRTCRSPE